MHRSWLSPPLYSTFSAGFAIAQRTSIPLRSISVVAFATSVQLFLGWIRNCATHLDSALLHLGRGFRHLCTALSRLGPQLRNAPRFRFAPSRSWLSPHVQEGRSPLWNASIPRGLLPSCTRCSIAARKKTAVPTAPMSAKTAISKCAIRGSNPGHPD